MGEVRSAQQKCIRRGLEEATHLLHFEHLLSTPDMSRAALSRMKVIAAEDVGVGCLGLLPVLYALDKGWPKLDQIERGRRLLQAGKMCVQSEKSRLIPCWAVTLFRGTVESATLPTWRPLEELVGAIDDAIFRREVDEAGILVEEVFLRHPIEKEIPLPPGIGLPRDAMADVWDIMELHCPVHMKATFDACRRAFGPPSRESVSARLFLYLALLIVTLEVPVVMPDIPDVSDDEVMGWIDRATHEAFAFPDWVFDRHTRVGRSLGRGFQHFFEEAALINNRTAHLREREDDAEVRARLIYEEQERLYGGANTAKQRARWRDSILSLAMEGQAA
jgi:hypothetical protein